MADAIPVHSEPKKDKTKKVEVAAPQVPAVDANGIELPKDYATQDHDGITPPVGAPEVDPSVQELSVFRADGAEVRFTRQDN